MLTSVNLLKPCFVKIKSEDSSIVLYCIKMAANIQPRKYSIITDAALSIDFTLNLILPLIEFYFELNFAVLCHSTKLRNCRGLTKSGVCVIIFKAFSRKTVAFLTKNGKIALK